MDRISEALASFLLNATWQIAVIALVAWLCSHLLRNAGARYRHALWVSALILSLALPLWGLLDLAGEAPRQLAAQNRGTMAVQEISNPAPNLAPLQQIDGVDESSPAFGLLLQKRRQPVTTVFSLSLTLAIFYALFFIYRLGTLCWSWQRTRILRQSVYEREIPRQMALVAARCRSALRLRNIPLLCSVKTAAPVTLGASQPLIILPETFFSTLQHDTLLSVLGHEMAHVSRRDYALNLIYEILSLPISFHPLVKLIKRQIATTREIACDELVTERLLEPKAYARAIVRMASEMVSPAGRAFTLGIFDADNLEERIMKLTQKTPRPGKRACRLLALTAFSLLCLSCLTISTFSFELRVEDQFAEAGVNRDEFKELAASPGGAATRRAEIPAQNQHKDTLLNLTNSQSPETESAQVRAQQACEALRRRAIESIPTLVSMLGDDRPTRLLQCWAGSRWSPALETFKQPSPGEQAAIALASMGRPAIEPLTNALGDSNGSVRRNAAWAIGELTNMQEGERTNSVQPLISLLDDSDEWVRMAAVRALGEIRDGRAVEKLLVALADDRWKVRELTAWALGEMKDQRAVQTLCRLLLHDAQVEVRERAAWALGEISDPEATQFLNQALNDNEPRVRDKARWALSEIEDSDG